MHYDDLIDALINTGIPFAEGEWRNADRMQATSYGVYALDGAQDLNANNKHTERFLEGTIDLFVRGSRGDTEAQAIETALESIGVFWRLNAGPMYENDTGYTHYEWVFNCLP